MLAHSGKKKHIELKTSAYALLAGLGLLQTALMAFAADAPPDSTERPLVRINPDYPQQALSENLEGWVNMRFTVNSTGAVEDPIVTDNCVWPDGEDPETCRSDDMFNEAALLAIQKWRYAPKVENGRAVAREGMHTIIRFALLSPEEKAAR